MIYTYVYTYAYTHTHTHTHTHSTKKLDPQVAAEANSALAAALASKPGTASPHAHMQGGVSGGTMVGTGDGGRGVEVGEERVVRVEEGGGAGAYDAEVYEGSDVEEERCGLERVRETLYSEGGLEVRAYSDDDHQVEEVWVWVFVCTYVYIRMYTYVCIHT